MTPNLDLIVGVALLVTSFCAASIFTFSSRKATNWPTIPEYVRYGLGAVTVMFAWRGANLLELSQTSDVVLGRANAEAAVAAMVTCYVAITVSYWFSRSYLRYRAWESISHVLKMIRRDPALRPVVVDPIEVAHAQGIYATGPGEGADAARREARRIRTPAG